jgi:hypothetical protein
MSRFLERKLVSQLDLLLPGGNGWPRYSDADTEEYWFGWRERTPLATRLALTVSVIVLGLYCWFFSLRHGPGTDPGQGLVQAETSRFFMVRQSFAMVKTIGCLGYFSDAELFALAMGRTEGRK